MAAEGDVRDYVELLLCLGERALERDIEVRRHDQRAGKPALAQATGRVREQPVRRRRLEVSVVERMQLVVEWPDALRQRDVFGHACKVALVPRGTLEGLSEEGGHLGETR